MLSDKDRQAIEKFRGEMLGVRRELRDVKRELRKDIDQLDGVLKFVNIAAVPLLIGIGGIGWAAYRRRRSPTPAGQAGEPGHEAQALRLLWHRGSRSPCCCDGDFVCGQQQLEPGRIVGRASCSPRWRAMPARSRPSSCSRAARRSRSSEGRRLEAQGARRLSGRRPRRCARCSSGLAEAELVEAKTRRADRYALLELEDPAAKDAKSRLVRVLDGKGSVLAEVVVGKKRIDAFGVGKSGTYVRKPADAADLARQRRSRCVGRASRTG